MSKKGHLFRLVLLISFAHAMVHLLEQSVGSVESVIGTEYSLDEVRRGSLGSALRLPYGLGAFLAGILADRWGARRVLLVYLFGGGLTCLGLVFAAGYLTTLGLFFLLGTFASIYHPAGLAVLSNATTPEERSRALGMHGVFGSLGIASAPFLAGGVLSLRPGDWRGYYGVLGVAAVVLGGVFVRSLSAKNPSERPSPGETATKAATSDGEFYRLPYALLVFGTACGGVIYAFYLHFLVDYLRQAPLMQSAGTGSAGAGNYAAAGALVFGAFGQFIAGRIAKPHRLAHLLSLVYFLNAPLLLLLSAASGNYRIAAAAAFAFVHFMNQPLYNSLLSRYVPRNRRSSAFGFSNLMGFGVGAAGPLLIKFGDTVEGTYVGLTAVAFVAAVMPLIVARWPGHEN